MLTLQDETVQVRRLIQQIPSGRRTVLCSATTEQEEAPSQPQGEELQVKPGLFNLHISY